MFTLYKKEINYYLNNPIGYIIMVLFAVFANFMFLKDIFLIASASMQPFFEILPWLLMIFVPALTMRALSEEKRTNTIETLLTLPISETQVVLAKFLALITIIAISLALTFGLPISLSFLIRSTQTGLYFPEILVGYLGALLLAGTFVSIGLFFSSLTKNQVIAFLLSVIVMFLLLLLASDYMNFLPKIAQDSISYFSPLSHMQNFTKGLLDIRSVFYFLSFMSVFLVLTIVDLEKRN